MNGTNLKAALFDFGGVLAEEGFKKGLIAIAGLNGLEPDAFCRTAFDLIQEGGYVQGKSTEEEYWQALRKKTGIEGTDESMRSEILSRFRLRPWMLHLVKKLREFNLIVCILSDQTNWLNELNTRLGFFDLFDYVFNSYHMGKSKRDPTIFLDVLKNFNLEAKRVLFIDDHLENIQRAEIQGLHTIHYKDKGDFLEQITEFLPSLGHLL